MDRLSEIRARCEAATPGPWDYKTNRHPNSNGTPWGWLDGPAGNMCWSGCQSRVDAAFIAHAREDIPFLLAEVEKLNKFADAYAPSSRIIALYLAKFCDRSLPYAEMISDAARRADSEITALTARAEKAEAALSDMRFACVNKDPGTPHQFEEDALKAAADILGEWPPKEGE